MEPKKVNLTPGPVVEIEFDIFKFLPGSELQIQFLLWGQGLIHAWVHAHMCRWSCHSTDISFNDHGMQFK